MAKKKAGRRELYDTHIKPNFKKIDEWLNDGASEKQIAEALGVSYASWNNYKVKYQELDDLCRKPRTQLVLKLRSALNKKALGMTITEKKVYSKKDPDGKEIKYTELTEKELPPDTTAIFGALNIYDSEYVKDKKNYELKQQELELKKMLAELKEW